MLNAANFHAHAARLVDTSINDAERRKLAAEVREAIEVVHSQDYGSFLEHFIPAFVSVLTGITKPQWTNNDVQKTRSIILEVMSRLPPNDILKKKCPQLMPLAMNVMQMDNEENSVTAIHIVFDLHKTFRPHLEAQVEPFLSFVRQLYSALPSTVDQVLIKPAQTPPNAPPNILPASSSFKVITECPLVVMFVFQLYPSCIRSNIQALLPLMLKAIQIQIPPSHEHVKKTASFRDFIAAQCKTVTFLVYLLKQLPALMNFDETWIPQSVVQLLKACPGNAIAIRKELLVATRHMLNSPLRKGFFSRIDALLDEKVIAGVGRASTEALRPLGYQFLAELIHGVRFELELPQLKRIIAMFSTNLHDPSFSFALQTNAVRLLLNLVEGILRRHDVQTCTPRSLLVCIMRTMVAKYVTIGEQVPRLLKMIDDAPKSVAPSSTGFPFSMQPLGDPLKEVHDCKILLKTLTLGLKTVVWSVINIRVQLKSPPDGAQVKQRNNGKNTGAAKAPEMVLLESETEVLTQLLPASQKCFKLYSTPRNKHSTLGPDGRSSNPAEKEIYDQFAQIFTILDVRSFQDIFGLRMQLLLDYIVESPSALTIAQHFLSNQNVAKYFADILLGFVVEKLPCLSGARPKVGAEFTPQQKEAGALLSLFKSLFCHIPNSLEHVLRLHVTTIVRKCISLALNCEDPYFYLQLLRYLFKSLTGGKKHDVQFDALFRDFMPLVEPVLSGLVCLYDGPHRLTHKDVIIELCLLIPARPATLFPYLKVQIKPILWSLKGSRENVQYGLRALDFWLEILQPSYIETLLKIVEPELSLALHRHLRYHVGNSFGTAALRILGKLGTRARRVPPRIEPAGDSMNNEEVVAYQFSWASVENPAFKLSADALVERACTVVLNEYRDGKAAFTSAQRRLAWQFCRVCLAPYFGLQNEDDSAFAAVDNAVGKARPDMFNSDMSSHLKLQLPGGLKTGQPPKTSGMSQAEVNKVRSLLIAVIISAALPDLPTPSPDGNNNTPLNDNISPLNFALGLSRYFGIILGTKSEAVHHEPISPSTLEPRMFIDAVIAVMARERADHRQAGLQCLEVFVQALLSYSGLLTSSANANLVPQAALNAPSALSYLLEKLCHCCYKRKWNYRLAGAVGLGAVVGLIPSNIFKLAISKSLEVRVVRGLMAVAEEPSKNSRFMCVAAAKKSLLKLVNISRNVAAEKDRINEITACLVSKLTSRAEGARDLAQEAIRQFSAVVKTKIVELIRPMKESIISPLRVRSIRQFSFPTQIGFLNAVNFCLRLDDPFIAADLFVFPMKTTFLSGVLSVPDDPMFEKLTEAEDGLRHKLIENKLIHTDVVVHLSQLRFHAVELLTTVAIRCTSFLQDPVNDDIFRRMITIFFKCLQSRDKKLVNVAKIGLKQAISQHQKPKETLQRNLRPILSNLADYKKLTLPYLEGLSRVLELLSHWFNVNLGDKLLEHLQHWTEPQKIVALKRGHPGTESRIGAAILDLFHLLPPAACKFMDRLVIIVLQLEFELGVAGPGVGRLGLQGKNMASTSPFREPLLKFCNIHAPHAIKFFLSSLANAQVRHLFFVLIRADAAGPLRENLRSDPGALIKATFASNPPFSYYGVALIVAILEDAPSNWLAQNGTLLNAVLKNWNFRVQEFKSAAGPGHVMNSNEIEEHMMITRILMRYCEDNLPANFVLFDLLKVFGLRMECDFSFVKTFLSEIVIKKFDRNMKRQVMIYFLDAFSKSDFTQEWKVSALQLIIIPMVSDHLRSSGNGKNEISTPNPQPEIAPAPDSVLDAELLKRVVRELFDQPDEVLRGYDEVLSAELLQLSTLLIQYIPIQVGDYRKELIKFGWAHLKREESVAKHWAFVNVSRFFQAYQAPPKIILQVYVALLRAHQGESKVLVRNALDILTPALPRRLEHNPADSKCPIWIRYTKKVLLEEGHSVINLVHIWQLVIRHADLFYVARGQFVPIMVTSLSRIGGMMQSNISAEYRRVALDLAKLIISWKSKEISDAPSVVGPPPQKKQRTDPDNNKPAGNADDFRPNTAMLNVTISFLIQIPFRPMDKRERELVAKRCIVLADEAIQMCPTLPFELPNFDRYLEVEPKPAPAPSTPRPKPGTPNAGSNVNVPPNDSKSAMQARQNAIRNEKLENVRIDKLGQRKVVIHAALELCVVFTKRQCILWVQNNSHALSILVSAVLSGRDPVAAKLFASLVVNILNAFPDLKAAPAQPPQPTQPTPPAPPTPAPPAATAAVDPTKNVSAAPQQPKQPSPAETFYSSVLTALERSLKSDDVSVNHCGLIVFNELFKKRPNEFTRYRDLLIKLFSRLVKESTQNNQGHSSINNSAGRQGDASGAGGGSGRKTEDKFGGFDSVPKIAVEALSKTLCLSILGEHITLLESTHRKAFIQGLVFLIERCVTVEVLLEIVRIVGKWVTWRQQVPQQGDKGSPSGRTANNKNNNNSTSPALKKEPLVLKEKVQLLLKMIIFERISGPGAQRLMNSYLEVILTIFGSKGCTDRRPELLPKLERAFLIGLNSRDVTMRARFFRLFDASLSKNPLGRLYYILARQDWSYLVEAYWIKHAVGLLLSAVNFNSRLVLTPAGARFPRLVGKDKAAMILSTTKDEPDKKVQEFLKSTSAVTSGSFCKTLQELLFNDDELAYRSWVEIFPCVWNLCSDADRPTMEKSLRGLLLKEYHIMQVSWQCNAVQALLSGAYRANPVPLLDPEIMLHLGSRWNTWFIVIEWLESRYEACLARGAKNTDEELKSIIHVLSKILGDLKENDHLTGLLKRHSSKMVNGALALEQRGREDDAQEMYSQLMQQYQATYYGGSDNKITINSAPIAQNEVSLCEGRWIHCAKKLCQWEVLTEFARSVVQSDLLHECLWRAPDWSAMKELLYRHPVEDGPSLRLYQAYIHLQENKLDSADSSITMGFKKSVERYCSLPWGLGHQLASDVVCQFQQLVELEESSRILAELNALSRLGGGNVNVEQKIENVKNILAGWRERLPSPNEPLTVWNNLLSWRNHVHAVVVNVLETLKEAANAKVIAAQNQNDPNAVANARSIAAPSSNPEVQAAIAITQALPQHVLVIGVNETAWNIHRFARACRKQGQPNVAIHALLKLYPFGTMELSEYFVKTMESAKSFYSGPTGLPNNLQYGLNELNRCNMDHFNARQKAQLFTMKGNFYKKLGKNEQAAESFAIALSISGDVSSAWFSWANYCDDMEKKKIGTVNPPSQWRQAAANCFLQAVRFGSRKARRMMPRVLRLLSLDSCSSSPGVERVSDVIMKFVDSLPAWLWVPWVDQLVRMLARKEADVARAILARVIHSYPQAVIFPLRSFLEEREEIDEPTHYLAREALKKPEQGSSSSLVPGNMTIGTLVRQIQAYSEALNKHNYRFQAVLAKKKQLETQLNPASPNIAAIQREYAKLREEVEVLPKHIEKLKESLTISQRRHARLKAFLQSSNGPPKPEVTLAAGGATNNQGGPSAAPDPAKEIQYTPYYHADWLLSRFIQANQTLYVELDRLIRELTNSTKPELEEVLLDFVNSLLYRFTRSSAQLSSPNTLGKIREWFDVLNKLPATKSQPQPTTGLVADLKTAFEQELYTALAVNPSQGWQPLIICLRKWRSLFKQRVDRKESITKTETVSRLLIDTLDSEIEVFGQYLVAEAEEIRTDSHIKIARFGADMHRFERPIGFTKQIEILGSDGKSYLFTTDTNMDRSGDLVQDRMIQLYRLINKSIFEKYAQAARRGMCIQLPKRLRMGRNMTITSVDDPSRTTLASIFENILVKRGNNNHLDGPREKYMERRTRQAIRDEKASRMDAYLHVRNSIPATSLSKEVRDKVSCPARLFALKKRFAQSLGTNSLLNYILGVGNRRLENMCFSWNNGTVSDLNIVPSLAAIEDGNINFSNDGSIDSVRLTPNLVQFMGNIGVNGPLTACMAIALDALRSKPELLQVYIEFMLFDVVGTVMNRRPVGTIVKKERLEKADDSTVGFSKRLDHLTRDIVVRRLNAENNADDNQKVVQDIIAKATNVERLAMMEPSWQAWF